MKLYSGVLVKCKNKVLLCKRSPKESRPNTWSIPCGHIEKEESPIDAAIREFKEETYINLVKPDKLLDFIETSFIKKINKEIKPNLEKAKSGHEHSECGYFDLDTLPIKNKKDDLYKIISKIL
jgi:ADP-ribose pyrophosphatase YjhB (NUDIX family)